MNHKELVYRAEKWLNSTIGCGFTLSELAYYSSYTGETPDVIGWKYGDSYLIECKASRADYFSDSRKVFRNEWRSGMGNYRYYMVPANLISEDELRPRWGLLYVYPKMVRIIKQPEFINKRFTSQRELPLLCSALRKVNLRGDLNKIYEKPI